MKAIALIGQPRSGSTIVCSYLNSIPRSNVLGEPHRTGRALEINTRYGILHFNPQHKHIDSLEQMRAFAEKHNLTLYGFKEVIDYNLRFNPIELTERYSDRLDQVYIMFRNPRKQWMSLYALGFNKNISIDVFNRDYLRLYNLTKTNNLYKPIILEKFMADADDHIEKATGLDIKTSFEKQQFAGGGDPHAMQSTVIKRKDTRVLYAGPELEGADAAYYSILDSIT